ncbi:hypothetical protein J6590_080378 [Homalodisca vitripennis]|nr:hypothetical protein J6590_080378 [Homalodisca vitripennis]
MIQQTIRSVTATQGNKRAQLRSYLERTRRVEDPYWLINHRIDCSCLLKMIRIRITTRKQNNSVCLSLVMLPETIYGTAPF